MTNFNFLSKSSSQSCGHSSVTLASNVGLPLAHRQGTMLKLLSVLVLILTIGVGNVWGKTYKLTQVTSTSGLNTTDMYVFEQDGYVMNNSISSSTLYTTNSFLTTGLAGTETYIWKLASATTGYKLQCKGKTGNNYLSNSSSTSMSWTASSSASDWSITFTNGIAKITNNSNADRFLGWTNNSTSHNYKAYASNNSCDTYPCEITVYRLEEEVSCTNSITITKGSNPANGSFALTTSGSVCIDNGKASTTVNATPSPNYHLASVTSTGGGDVGDISDNSCTVTNIGANTTINVTFEADPTYTVTWVAGSNSSFSTQTNYAGTALTDPGTPSADLYCPGGKVFKGWTALEINGEQNSAPADLFASVSGKSIPVNGKTYYAVFATETKETINVPASNKQYTATITYSQLSSGASYANSDGDYSSTGTASDESSTTVGWTTYNVQNASSKLHFKSNSGYIYNKNSWGTINNVSFSDNQANNFNVYIGSSSQPSSAGSGGFFKIAAKTVSGGPYVATITITYTQGSPASSYEQITYSKYATSCCNPLGSINGSVLLTKSSNSVTVKGWTYTQGSAAAESNISTYDVYLYSSADNYETPATQTCAYNAKGTGVTFTGLSNANTYKLKIGATGNTNYCDITPVQVTTIDGSSAETFQLPCVAAGLAYNTASVPKAYQDAAFTNTLTNSHNLDVTYSVLNANPSGCVTVSNVGLVTIVSAGTATIKATSAEQTVNNVKYCEGEASYSLTVNKLNITPSVLYASTSLTAGGTSASPTITGNTGNGGVTYSSSNTDVATVDASTGVVTAKAAGSATITASIAATTNYNAGSATANFTISAASQCVTPTFSVATGTYNENKSVELGCLTEGATIYYTTDGSDPTSSGTRSTYSSAIPVGVTTTIRAYAEKSGMTASEEGSATITIKCASPTFSPDEGSFTSAQNVTLATTYGDEIYYTTDGSDPATNGTKYTSAIAVSTTNTTIKAVAKKENCANSDLATATYTIKCETPTITPGTGDVTTGQAITLGCATEGATIYYTMGDNPADPTTASTPYDPTNKPVVSAATTIKAIAVKTGWSNSDVASATYAMKYTVTLNAGTGTCASSVTQASHGESVTLPDATIAVTGWSFAGWKAESAVTTETNVKPSFVDKTYIPTGDITLYAVYEKSSGGTAVDEIDRDFIGVTSSSYTEWSAKSGSASSAEYAGQSAGGDSNSGDAIQFRSNNSNSGLVTTTSGGKAKKVTVTWNSYTANDRTLDIYGKGTAYTDATNLYATATQGTKLGSIVKGTSTELTITGDYEFIGMRSYSGAMYLLEIDIEWSTASTKYYSNPSSTVTLTYDGNGQTSEASTVPASSNYTIGNTATVVAKPEGLVKTGYTFSGWNTKDDGTGDNYVYGTEQQSFTINDNTTLYAKWTINKHTVSVSTIDNGNITATPTGASAITEGNNNTEVAYGTVVTLSPTNDEHYSFGSWNVTAGGNTVTVTNNQFTMPDADVTVSATFTEAAKRNVKFYSNGTQLGTTQEVYVGEAPVAETAVYESCLEGSDHFYGWTTEEWTGAINATTLADKTVITGDIPAVVAGEGAVEYYAVWAKATATPTTSYAKITSGLEEDNYVIAYSYNNGEQIVLKNEEHANPVDGKLAGYSLVLSGTKYSNPDNAYVWTLKAQNDGSYYIYNAAVEKYVNATTSTATLSDTPTKFTLEYNSSESRWIIKLASNTGYAFHGYVTSSNYTVTDRDFRVSSDAISHTNAYRYRIYLYKNEKETTYSDFRTNCCSLKPVTNVQVGTIGETSIELTWTAPTSKTGITKYQIVDAEHEIAQDVTNVDATSATVTGLTECTTYNFKVVSVGDDCSSNSNEVEATPFAGAKVVTFDYNGGSGATTSASTSCGVATVNLPTPNARDGYNFKGWNDGTQTLAPSTATYTPAATMTLTAQWAQLYTVHYEFAGASGAPEDAQYEAGATVELPSEPNKGFLAPFEAWDYSEAVTMVDETHFTMPASDLTITATYDEVVGQWILVTDESQLVANSYVIIAAAGSNKAMKITQSGSTTYRDITDIVKNGSIIENPSNNVQIFVLEAGNVENSWSFKCLNGDYKDKYIYANATSSNSINTKAEKDNNGSWKLDLENGYATAQGENTRNILSFNNDRFACYGNTNQGAIAIYEFREGTFYDVNMPAVAPTGGTVKANTTMAKAGDVVKLTYTPSRGYTVETLTVTGATSGEITISPAVEAGVTEYTFTMPAEAVTVAASFDAVPAVEYSLVENADDLAVGMQFLMVSNYTNGGYRAAGTKNGDYLHGISIPDPNTKQISITTEEVVDFVLSDIDNDKWQISSLEGNLSHNSSPNIVYTNNSASIWTITIGDEAATNVKDGTTCEIRYNYNNGTYPRFKTYASGQQPIYLYALPYTTYNFTLSGCKTIKVVTGYTYTYTIKNSDEPTSKPGDNYTFLHKWTDGTNTYAVGDEVTVSAAKTLQPCWKVTPTADADINTLPTSVTEIVVNDGKTLTIGAAGRSLDNLTVEAGGKVSIAENKTLTVNTFTIESTMASGKSGQLNGATVDNFEASEAYIDITLGKGGTNQQWHAFTVPFEVDVMNGIYDLDNNPLVNEVNYAIMEYHGDERAKGNYGWKKIRTTLVPGTFYIMATDGYRTTYRFKKKAGAALVAANSKPIYEYPLNGGTEADKDNGWNGLGNPNLFYGKVNLAVQVLDPESYTYVTKTANSTNFVVGTPFFYQAAATGTMVMATADAGANYAPARVQANEIKDIPVSFGNEEFTDYLYVSANEDALNTYETGKDLVKMMMTNTPSVAQIFGKAYNSKLSMVYTPIVNNQAEVALELYAPANGQYTISAPSMENADLYLTQNGSIIWNLSMSAYELELTKGTTEGYGLLLQAKAPGAATGVDNIDASEAAQKVIINDHVYILRNGQMYDVNGKAVK